MSKVSTIYDTLLTTLATLLSGKTRIPNTYAIEENPMQYLEDSWGLRIDPENPAASEFCRFSRLRTFTVILCREVFADEFDTTNNDTAVKALLEDVYTLQKDFMNPDQIGIESNIEKIDMGGTGPIVSLIGSNKNFIFIEVYFNIQITDNIEP